ncbi:DNA-binding domain-containing protein [Sinorhizobium garamanticum]|uniref:DNA-binding domain-containing protein n=1 Tax=Sinorhizobium garamanticum TaxID=680247 RepID=A0ABY8D9Z0_9HYPH|nr:DNA-binding domain-containing protein [Sinorhizobium garamanticum]WEX86350.1 DNA-binding domain-containing protein [Sinorhizobium garamanticum]
MRVAESISDDVADRLDYPTGFVPALLDPGRVTPSLVAGPRGKAANKRFNVYRNNVTVSLIDALAAAFPATMRITGETFFRAMARFHARETPPTSPLLFEYGRDFPAFIERYEYAQSMPWLADVARIERAWLDAYHAADAPALPPHALASFPAEALGDAVFEAHPSTRVVRSAYPALTIFSANRGSGPVGRIEAREPESALITRPALDVEVRRLPPGADVFLGSLLAAEPFGSAAAAASAGCPEFDLATAIVVMLEAGAFAAPGRMRT